MSAAHEQAPDGPVPDGAISDVADEDRPNPARMYDYALGGSANFEADRRAVDESLALNPEGMLQARSNRAFLRRTVNTLAQLGVRQFLDLGSGVPTAGHVHQIAQRADPAARVVYVDNEPVAAAYSRELLAAVPGAAVLPVDLRDVHRVLNHPDTRRLLDLDEPVAVLMFAVLHFITSDQEVADLIAAYRDATPPGSYLAISHASYPDDPSINEMHQRFRVNTRTPFGNRTADQVRALFTGYELLEPGVVPVSTWRPDPGPDPNRPSVEVSVGGVGARR